MLETPPGITLQGRWGPASVALCGGIGSRGLVMSVRLQVASGLRSNLANNSVWVILATLGRRMWITGGQRKRGSLWYF
jgi:hypothetical protein